MSEFSDRPLVVGSLTGLRAFRVDELGRLTGVVQRKVWLPGVNEAVCRAGGVPMTTSARQYESVEMRMRAVFGRSREFKYLGVCLVKHHPAAVQCSCGFYAYFDHDANPYTDQPVRGLIRGFGTVTVGSRGFRASKAEILCLIDTQPRPWWRRLTTRGLILAVMLTLAVAAWITVTALSLAWWTGLLPGFVIGWCAPEWVLRRRRKLLITSNETSIPEKVRRAYPDVPVIAGLEAALERFPLTAPPPPREPSPEDPDFWTRETL